MRISDWSSDVCSSDLNTIELKRGFVGTSGITPSDELYVRNNLSPPDEAIVADRDAWEVAIEGVAEPRTMTLGELRTLGIATVAMVLQRSEEHTSELQSLMRSSYAVFCLKKKTIR